MAAVAGPPACPVCHKPLAHVSGNKYKCPTAAGPLNAAGPDVFGLGGLSMTLADFQARAPVAQQKLTAGQWRQGVVAAESLAAGGLAQSIGVHKTAIEKGKLGEQLEALRAGWGAARLVVPKGDMSLHGLGGVSGDVVEAVATAAAPDSVVTPALATATAELAAGPEAPRHVIDLTRLIAPSPPAAAGAAAAGAGGAPEVGLGLPALQPLEVLTPVNQSTFFVRFLTGEPAVINVIDRLMAGEDSPIMLIRGISMYDPLTTALLREVAFFGVWGTPKCVFVDRGAPVYSASHDTVAERLRGLLRRTVDGAADVAAGSSGLAAAGAFPNAYAALLQYTPPGSTGPARSSVASRMVAFAQFLRVGTSVTVGGMLQLMLAYVFVGNTLVVGPAKPAAADLPPPARLVVDTLRTVALTPKWSVPLGAKQIVNAETPEASKLALALRAALLAAVTQPSAAPAPAGGGGGGDHGGGGGGSGGGGGGGGDGGGGGKRRKRRRRHSQAQGDSGGQPEGDGGGRAGGRAARRRAAARTAAAADAAATAAVRPGAAGGAGPAAA